MGGPYYRVRLMFEKILRELEALKAKVSVVSEEIRAPRGSPQPVYLSVGIQKTVDALRDLKGPASAAQVAAITGRARAVESMHLNELFRMGLAWKEKRGRARVFNLKEDTVA